MRAPILERKACQTPDDSEIAAGAASVGHPETAQLDNFRAQYCNYAANVDYNMTAAIQSPQSRCLLGGQVNIPSNGMAVIVSLFVVAPESSCTMGILNKSGRSNRNFRTSVGFTLVELLVVIGIVTILLGLLLPTLTRAREAGLQLQCLANMRQLGVAWMCYARDNKGRLPGSGSGAAYNDWIFWHTDPNDPHMKLKNVGVQDLRRSALAVYLATSSEVTLSSIFRCPSDDVQNHPYVLSTDKPKYEYSYSLNIFMSAKGDPLRKHIAHVITDIRNSSRKSLFIDESEATADDGVWIPQLASPPPAGAVINLSDRHESIRRGIYDLNHRGNCIFCDGHGECCAAEQTTDQRSVTPEL